MTVLFTGNENLSGKRVNLLTDVLGSPVPTRVQDITLARESWDNVVDTMADLPTPVGGPPGLINLTAGSWFFRSTLAIGNNIIVVPAATTCHLKGIWGKTLSGIATNVIAVNGAAILETMQVSGDATLLLSGVDGICHCIGCDLYGVSANVFTTVSWGDFSWIGGRWGTAAGTPDGLRIGCLVRRILLDGVQTDVNLAAMVRWVVGIVDSALISNCNTPANFGIVWPAANIPVQGMAIMGNNFNSAVPFSGFTAASARVNAKGNMGGAGPITETPIVP